MAAIFLLEKLLKNFKLTGNFGSLLRLNLYILTDLKNTNVEVFIHEKTEDRTVG